MHSVSRSNHRTIPWNKVPVTNNTKYINIGEISEESSAMTLHVNDNLIHIYRQSATLHLFCLEIDTITLLAEFMLIP